MAGVLTASAPRAPAEAASWAVHMLRDVVGWVEALRRGPQVLTGYASTMRPSGTEFRRALIFDDTNGVPLVC